MYNLFRRREATATLSIGRNIDIGTRSPLVRSEEICTCLSWLEACVWRSDNTCSRTRREIASYKLHQQRSTVQYRNSLTKVLPSCAVSDAAGFFDETGIMAATDCLSMMHRSARKENMCQELLCQWLTYGLGAVFNKGNATSYYIAISPNCDHVFPDQRDCVYILSEIITTT